jgi:hypothetical protein
MITSSKLIAQISSDDDHKIKPITRSESRSELIRVDLNRSDHHSDDSAKRNTDEDEDETDEIEEDLVREL